MDFEILTDQKNIIILFDMMMLNKTESLKKTYTKSFPQKKKVHWKLFCNIFQMPPKFSHSQMAAKKTQFTNLLHEQKVIRNLNFSETYSIFGQYHFLYIVTTV